MDSPGGQDTGPLWSKAPGLYSGKRKSAPPRSIELPEGGFGQERETEMARVWCVAIALMMALGAAPSLSLAQAGLDPVGSKQA